MHFLKTREYWLLRSILDGHRLVCTQMMWCEHHPLLDVLEIRCDCGFGTTLSLREIVNGQRDPVCACGQKGRAVCYDCAQVGKLGAIVSIEQGVLLP